MLKKYILSESVYDYKYKSILGDLKNFDVIEGDLLKLLFFMITRRKQCVYHIRYIKYQGLPKSLLRLFFIFIITKISSNKILWSCHNIEEHNIPNKNHNKTIRNLLLHFSDGIIVFHEKIKEKLPSKYSAKIKVANFGSFKSFLENKKNRSNDDFSESYKLWKENRNIANVEIISVSTAKKSRLDILIRGTENSCLNTLVIAPGIQLQDYTPTKNIFLYNKSAVYKEVFDILSSDNEVIGFIGHCNYSVATSLFMFASFDKPIICFNCEPISSLVNQYGLGEIVDSYDEVHSAYMKIKSNYANYSNNVKNFIKNNSWTKSKSIHENLLLSFFNDI